MAQPPTPFSPPKTVPVFRVQKTAWREYLLSGGAMQIVVAKPADQLATAPTTVTGQLYVDASLTLYPPAVTIVLIQRGAEKGTQTASVDPKAGTFTATFPGNTLAAGNPAYAKATCTLPTGAGSSANFNVT